MEIRRSYDCRNSTNQFPISKTAPVYWIWALCPGRWLVTHLDGSVVQLASYLGDLQVLFAFVARAVDQRHPTPRPFLTGVNKVDDITVVVKYLGWIEKYPQIDKRISDSTYISYKLAIRHVSSGIVLKLGRFLWWQHFRHWYHRSLSWGLKPTVAPVTVIWLHGDLRLSVIIS